jgi:hypothetical protein
MRTIMIAGVLVLLAGAAGAEPTQLFYNERGQITGSSSTSGNVTTDRTGKMTGRQSANPTARRYFATARAG